MVPSPKNFQTNHRSQMRFFYPRRFLNLKNILEQLNTRSILHNIVLLKTFTISALILVVALVVAGGAPNISAVPWKTFYSPEYKFAFDYPYNQTTRVTDRATNGTVLDKFIQSPLTNFIVKVEPATRDPQEILVALSQKLSSDYDSIEGGVKPIVVDRVLGYMYSAIGLTNGGIMITLTNFEHKGYIYTFMVIPLNGFDRTDHHRFISSIKFFD